MAVCPAYLTFVRDRRQAPVYDDHFGHVRAEYNVNYAQWSLGPHMRRVDDDNETMLRYSLVDEDLSDYHLSWLKISTFSQRVLIKYILYILYNQKRFGLNIVKTISYTVRAPNKLPRFKLHFY